MYFNARNKMTFNTQSVCMRNQMKIAKKMKRSAISRGFSRVRGKMWPSECQRLIVIHSSARDAGNAI